MYPSTFSEVLGIFVHEQAKALASKNIEIKVISPQPWAPFPINRMNKKWKAYSEIPYRQIREGIEVFYPKYLEVPGSYLGHYSGESMYLGIKTLIDKIYNNFKFNLIHAHTAYPDGFAALWLKMKYNSPLIVTIHGVDVCSSAPHKPTIERSNRLKKSILEVFKSADKTVGVSSMVRDTILKYSPIPKKISFINNGIPFDKIKSKSFNGKSQKIKIISVGYLIKRKGHEFVIHSIPALISEGFEVEYIIIGDGKNRKYLESLVREKQLEGTVSFWGIKSQEEVFHYLSEADIFCLPSWDEAFGVVYIEAMAAGLPVIACKGQGIQDVIEDGINGMLVEPKSADSVRDALRKLILNPDLCRKMGQTAAKHVNEKFTWSVNADKYIEIYKEVLNSF